MTAEHTKKISIWGTSRAGKTVYLIALYWAFQSLRTTWKIRADDAVSEAFIDSAREDFFVKHRFPEKTVEQVSYHYTLTRLDGDKAVFKLEFIDAPGELYAEYYDITTDKKKRKQTVRIAQRDKQDQESKLTPQDMFELLASSDGIIVLLDPAWKYNPQRTQPYDQLLAQVFRDLERHHHGAAQPYIALCYTKVDATDALWRFAKQLYDPGTMPNGFNPLRDCYRFRDKRTARDENPCAQHCKVFEELQSKLLEDQLEMPLDHFACFHISSIGRVDDTLLNVGSLYQWEREEVIALAPPVFHAKENDEVETPKELSYMRDGLDDIYVNETFEPFSINKPNAINPYHVNDPLVWLLEQL